MYFKSGTDALLLAAYIIRHSPKCTKFVELGSGEGFSSHIIAKKYINAQGLLVDINPLALQKAQENAPKNISYLCQDIAQRKNIRAQCARLGFMQAEVVFANPPYYSSKNGRTSQADTRALALHQEEYTLLNFCKCANDILRHHGFFFMLHVPSELNHVFEILNKCNFGVRSLLPIHTRPHKSAKWVLILARKDAKDDLQLEQSLCLYVQEEGKELSEDALCFCPWLEAVSCDCYL